MSRIWPESHCTQAIGHQLLTDWTEFSEIDSGIADLYEELRGMLPIRFNQGATPEQRRKIEWMRDYVNKSIDEQGLNEQKVVLPS